MSRIIDGAEHDGRCSGIGLHSHRVAAPVADDVTIRGWGPATAKWEYLARLVDLADKDAP